MKKKALALLAILLTSFAMSEAKVVTRAEYCHTLMMIYDAWDEDEEERHFNQSYGFIEAYRDHCM